MEVFNVSLGNRCKEEIIKHQREDGFSRKIFQFEEFTYLDMFYLFHCANLLDHYPNAAQVLSLKTGWADTGCLWKNPGK